MGSTGLDLLHSICLQIRYPAQHSQAFGQCSLGLPQRFFSCTGPWLSETASGKYAKKLPDIFSRLVGQPSGTLRSRMNRRLAAGRADRGKLDMGVCSNRSTVGVPPKILKGHAQVRARTHAHPPARTLRTQADLLRALELRPPRVPASVRLRFPGDRPCDDFACG